MKGRSKVQPHCQKRKREVCFVLVADTVMANVSPAENILVVDVCWTLGAFGLDRLYMDFCQLGLESLREGGNSYC